MRRIRLFHWNATEAKPLIEQLRAGGYTVDYPGDRILERRFGSLSQSPPHAILIDLTRLPSQGRHLAVAIRSKEKMRSIPIVFVDGDPEKVEKIREELPDAIYATRSRVASALKRAKPLVSPAAPPYSNRTTAQKLGIREGACAGVVDAPRDYAQVIGALPAGASFEEDPEGALTVTLWFVRQPGEYLAALPRIRALAGKSRLWIIYPKQQGRQKNKGGITLFFIRDEGLAVGLVHYKTCSLDATWTGMLLAPMK